MEGGGTGLGGFFFFSSDKCLLFAVSSSSLHTSGHLGGDAYPIPIHTIQTGSRNPHTIPYPIPPPLPPPSKMGGGNDGLGGWVRVGGKGMGGGIGWDGRADPHPIIPPIKDGGVRWGGGNGRRLRNGRMVVGSTRGFERGQLKPWKKPRGFGLPRPWGARGVERGQELAEP